MTSPLHFEQVNLDTSFGALLIGGLISTALWGVTCIQTYTYFTRKSQDGPVYKAIIVLLFALDTLDSVLLSHFMYYYMVIHSADPVVSLVPNWSSMARSVVSFLSDFIVRTMFAIRVYKFSKNNLILIAWITIFSILAFVSGLFSLIKILQNHSVVHVHELSDIVSFIFAAATVADFSISISLCYLLHKSRTGFRRTDSLIRVLMIYSVNSGAIVLLDAIPTLVTFITMPQTLVYDITYLSSGKLYFNSYLACLNAREAIREEFLREDPVLVSQLEQGIATQTEVPSAQSVSYMNALNPN
ncbi:hypothetical protein BDN72DRAFT_303629 [Pluteus cervinus]|uniref:Uncharacterized protein n=1 Tax=Pluteus cervinus TaxID=181527 RepID=A0ACD3B428_9AGAR|nr:hypothetical protein BDN72DRAFT_303629 [Pluteus cervinus]